MHTFFKSIFFILLFLFNFSLIQSQSITEYQFDFDLLSAYDADGNPIPKEDMNVETLRNKFGRTFAAKDSIFAMRFNNPGAVLKRVLIDLKNRTQIAFYEADNEKAYEFTNDLSDFFNLLDAGQALEAKFNEGKKHSELLFGLPTVESSLKFNTFDADVLMTREIYAPMLQSFLAEHKLVAPAAVLHIQIDDPRHGSYAFGIKNFNAQLLNPDLLSSDTSGMMTLEEAIAKDRSERAAEQSAQAPEIQNSNQKLLEDLIEQGVISAYEPRIKSGRADSVSFDIPSILMLARNGGYGFSKMNQEALRSTLEKNNMLSPSVDKLLRPDNPCWNDLSAAKRYAAVVAAAIKDEIESPSSRGVFVYNLNELGYKMELVSVVTQKYLGGDASVADLFNEIEVLTPLERKTFSNTHDLVLAIQSYLDMALRSVGLNPVFTYDANTLAISIGDMRYAIDLTQYLEVSDDLPLRMDHWTYYGMTNQLYQILADHDLPQSISLYFLKGEFVDMEKQNMDQAIISATCPELDLDMDQLYFVNYTGQLELIGNRKIGMHFMHSDKKTEEVALYDFSYGMNPNKKYLKTQDKTHFIAFLRQYETELRIPPIKMKELEKNLYDKLITLEDAITYYLTDVLLIIDPAAPKHDEHRTMVLNHRGGGFGEFYPFLYRIVKEDFVVGDFQEVGQDSLKFRYKNQYHTLDLSTQSMARFFVENMKQTDSGRVFYKSEPLSLDGREHYFYIRPEVKDALQAIFPIL